MKNFNLIKRLFMDSHEKQSPQRFARYAAMLIMLLTLGVGQMWGWNSIELCGEPTGGWSNYVSMPETGDNTGVRYLFIYMEKDQYFKFRWNGSKPVGNDENLEFTAYNSGGRMYKWDSGDPAAAIYKLNTGIVRVCTDQTSGNDSQPWVWLLRPTIHIRHNWSGSSWSDEDMTDNNDGTYKYYGNYGGNYTYVGVTDMEYNADGSNCYKKFQNTATVNGSPSNGDRCIFEYNASGYRSSTNSTTNTGTLTITKLCTVKYDGNDKTSGTVPDDDADNLYDTYITLSSNTLTKSGYTHTGWNTAADGSGDHYDKGASFQVKEATQTLYAEWTASVTLAANGGNNGGSASAFYKGDALTITTTPTHATAGYTIRGYYAESACTTLIAAVDGTLEKSKTGFTDSNGKWTASESKTLHTKWDNHYTVTFNEHDADIHGTESATATYGSAMPAATMPSKTGYTFRGYYTGADSTGTKYYNPDGTSATTWAETADTELHACWKGNSYQVAFDANEGSGSMANQNLTYGAAATVLTNNTYTREGYYFLGWNTNADGSGTDYYNGESVQNLTSIAGGIVTLYAQWAKKYTVYFILAGVGWNPPYAKAKITFDGQTYYPITGSNEWSAMTSVSKGIWLSNVTYNSSHSFKLYKIEGIPEGAQIDFSSNSSGTSNVGFMSWTPEKPYFMYGNKSWYGIDKYAVIPANKDTIVQATEMSVAFGSTLYGIDEHGDDGKYAIVNLSADTWYTNLKYYNWIADGWSGCTATGDASNMITSSTSTGVSDEWTLNGSNPFCIQTTVAGEYKFVLTGYDKEGAPKAKIYYPVGVSLGALDVTQAVEGASTTVTLTATPAKTYLMTHPTYYYQMSTDNKTWTTIATSNSNTFAYTFAAQTCKFRVILENDAKLKTTSGTQSFTAYSTKSFYVYNPYNNSTNNWRYLHLYTWDSNDGNKTYNGSWPGGYIHCTDPVGTHGTSCVNGNDIVDMGNDWFYITINATANCFMLVGESPYDSHQTVTCYVNNYIEGGKYMIYTENSQNKVVAYDAKGASDYRLKYTDGAVTRYSPIYNTTLDGTEVITSMWMDANSSTASITIQQGTGNKTWDNRRTYSNSSSDGFGGLVDSYHRDHGYAFLMKVTLNTGTPTSSTITNVAAYTGSYYVRTDGLEGGWNVYKTHKHTMHHSEASLNGTPAYNYYLCKWIGSAGTNVKFTVANDYNPELVASLEGDASSSDPLYNRQTIPTATNVRFSWNSRTNTLTRAYLSAATEASSRFLVMTEKATGGGYTIGKIYDENGCQLITGKCKVSGLNEHELLFEDLGNWVYQLTMQAKPGATAKVTAKYNGQEPDFIPLTELIGGTGSSIYKYRIVYDFKTNILTNAWVATDAIIDTEIDLNTNVMIIRGGQNAATQITFGDDGKVIHAKKLIGVMEFAYDNMVGKMSSWNSQAYQYCMYYISFPFNVNVNDIFGIGEYGTDWKLQYYDGAERASKGFYKGDGTTTFWKDVPANGTLEEYVGYSLLLNRIKFNDRTSDIWENKGSGSKIYLYFPSTADAENIQATTKTINVPGHTCTKGAFSDGSGKNHDITDSHWNMMGVPIFANRTTTETLEAVLSQLGTESDFRYLYEWNYEDNNLSVVSGTSTTFTFEAMKSYMVQFHGPITFAGAGVVPSAFAARRTPSDKNYNIELQVLNPDEQMINHAYVNLEEGANADFALNEDLYMENNNRAINVYTFAGSYEVSANILPIEDATIPVGVYVKTAGTYTFHMPDNFSGTVTLIDTFDGTETNLALEDYTVDLEKGTINDRFMLRINIKNTPTAIDGVEDGSGSLKDGKAHKFIENGQMYILQNGAIYDAQGKRVK